MSRTSVVRDGIIAGLLGATAVVLWFFVIDVVAGLPFRTPLLLAAAGYGVFGGQLGGAVVVPIVAYTVFHYAAFCIASIVISASLEAAETKPGHFAGLFLLFAVFEVGFYGLCMLLSMLEVIGALAWYQIGAANLVASVVVGAYLWRRHPAAARGLAAALKGTTP